MHFDSTKQNVGHIDRLARAAIGALLILGAFNGTSWMAAPIGALLLATAYFRFYPFYALFHFRSNKALAPARTPVSK